MRTLLTLLALLLPTAGSAQSSLIDAGSRGAAQVDRSGRAITAAAVKAAIGDGRVGVGGVSGQAATELVGLPPLNDLTFGAPGGLSRGAGDYTRTEAPGDLTRLMPRVAAGSGSQTADMGGAGLGGGASIGVPSLQAPARASGSGSAGGGNPLQSLGGSGSPADLLRSFGR